MKRKIQKLICALGIIASVGLAALSLPSHFMATPMESQAGQIMREGLKQEVTMQTDQDEIVLLSHYAHSNIQEWVYKSRVMFFSAGFFFLLFLSLLIMDIKKGKPTTN